MSIREVIKEIKSILINQDIQIKKYGELRDSADNKLIEMDLTMDAILFDHQAIEERISKIEEMLQ